MIRPANMASPRLTTGTIARLVSAELIGPDDVEITGPASIEQARPGEICFIRSVEYAAHWPTSSASAALVTRGIPVQNDSQVRSLLVVDDADLAIVRLLEHLSLGDEADEPGIDPRAAIDASATIAPSAFIGPNCVVGAGARIDAGAKLIANVYVGAGATIGERTVLHPGVVIYHHCTIGQSCTLHANVSVGADGFGYRPAADGTGLVKVPHIGDVVIGDHVEVGANSCIDRAKFGSTSVGEGTKIDNLVQIGHNSSIGKHCVICGHTGIAGSVRIGDGAIIGGKVGLPDNVSIGAGASIGGGSLVLGDVPPGEKWVGVPAAPAREAFERAAAMRNLPQIARDVKKLARELRDKP